jgi:hypothetical protein
MQSIRLVLGARHQGTSLSGHQSVGEPGGEAAATDGVVWLRRVVVAALSGAPPSGEGLRQGAVGGSLDGRVRYGQGQESADVGRMRLYTRLRHDDWLILRERAEGRGMPAATYVAALLRAHLRALAPLPQAEMDALKGAIAALGAIGRNLNQIARVAHQTGHIGGPGRNDLELMLKICVAMREHIKALVRANAKAWESGYAQAGD